MSESRRIEDGALYLVEERLDTFKDASWPYDTGSCTVVKVSKLNWNCYLTTKMILQFSNHWREDEQFQKKIMTFYSVPYNSEHTVRTP